MEFQIWSEQEQLIAEVVTLGVILEALASEDAIEDAAQRAKEDPDAIGDLLELIRPVIEKALAFKLPKGDRNAWFGDLVQDILMTVWKTMSGELASPIRGPLRPWLAVVINNTMLNRIKREKVRRSSSLSAYENPEDLAPIDDDPAENAQRDELWALALGALPDKYQEILKLHYFQELKHSQIAKKLGIPEPTSKTRLHKAKQLLKDQFEKMGIPD